MRFKEINDKAFALELPGWVAVATRTSDGDYGVGCDGDVAAAADRKEAERIMSEAALRAVSEGRTLK
jgi:hypothetical protein